ncbi:MAG: 30S ribosomal protein S2 [bacterium]|nr:30S ribosomal protein S2 [bacterium]
MKITIEELLKAGVHFGHKTERWNPKMKPYIFAARNDIYIIDLLKTIEQMKKAHTAVKDIVANGGEILYVGTKKQAKDIIKQEATATDSYFISERWLGGLLTNFSTVKKTIERLKDYEKKMATGGFKNFTKKEVTGKEREIEKLTRMFGGIKNMNRLPEVIFIVDTKKHKIAIHEANLMGIPVIALVDTNSDPDAVAVPIPGNDDAIKSIEIVTQVISSAVAEGKSMRKESGSEAKSQEKGFTEEVVIETADRSDKPRRNQRRVE